VEGVEKNTLGGVTGSARKRRNEAILGGPTKGRGKNALKTDVKRDKKRTETVCARALRNKKVKGRERKKVEKTGEGRGKPAFFKGRAKASENEDSKESRKKK